MARRLIKEEAIPAPPSQVWDAWTTSDGCRTFFAPDAHVELSHGGMYELYFDAAQPLGLRGSEGCRVVSFEPERMLTFTWNAPPHFPSLRAYHTLVTLDLEPTEEETTTVRLTQAGWKDGDEWQRLYEYFDCAWNSVLQNLRDRFLSGPIDWE